MGKQALSPVHTVAEKCDCRRKRRLSHFSATVWTELYDHRHYRRRRHCHYAKA